MTKELKEKFLDVVSKLPHFRLGQIIALSSKSIESLYNVSDEELIFLIRNTFKLPQKKVEDQIQAHRKIYVHKGAKVKAIHEYELDAYLESGYVLGRKDKK